MTLELSKEISLKYGLHTLTCTVISYNLYGKMRRENMIFGPSGILLKIEGLLLRPRHPISVTYSTSSFIWLEKFLKRDPILTSYFKVLYTQ